MVASGRIVHHSLKKDCITFELIKVANKLELFFELIYKLLERLLGTFDDLKETVNPLLVLNLEGVSLCKLFGHIRKGCDAVR